jgi:hypothetical protein
MRRRELRGQRWPREAGRLGAGHDGTTATSPMRSEHGGLVWFELKGRAGDAGKGEIANGLLDSRQGGVCGASRREVCMRRLRSSLYPLPASSPLGYNVPAMLGVPGPRRCVTRPPSLFIGGVDAAWHTVGASSRRHLGEGAARRDRSPGRSVALSDFCDDRGWLASSVYGHRGYHGRRGAAHACGRLGAGTAGSGLGLGQTRRRQCCTTQVQRGGIGHMPRRCRGRAISAGHMPDRPACLARVVPLHHARRRWDLTVGRSQMASPLCGGR